MLVFGAGSGRCGTCSLRLFLDLQRQASFTHELNFEGTRQPLPWQPNLPLASYRLTQLQQLPGRLKGDVGFYWLPYTEWIFEHFPDARVICLQRNKADTVASYLRRTEGRNHWTPHDGTRWKLDEVWDRAFPKYHLSCKQQAVAYYWEDYYTTAIQLQHQYANRFRIFSTDALNRHQGQRDILNFIAIPPEEMIFTPSFRLNSSGEQRASI